MSPFGRIPAFPVRTFPSCYSGKRRHLSPRKQRAALSGFTRANSEWAILPLPGQGHKPSLHPFPLTLKGTSQNSGRLFAGLTHSLLPQQWVSKGTSPFGRTLRIPGTNLRQLTLRKEALSQREFFWHNPPHLFFLPLCHMQKHPGPRQRNGSGCCCFSVCYMV